MEYSAEHLAYRIAFDEVVPYCLGFLGTVFEIPDERETFPSSTPLSISMSSIVWGYVAININQAANSLQGNKCLRGKFNNGHFNTCHIPEGLCFIAGRLNRAGWLITSLLDRATHFSPGPPTAPIRRLDALAGAAAKHTSGDAGEGANEDAGIVVC